MGCFLRRTDIWPWSPAQILQWSSDDPETHRWTGGENWPDSYHGIFWRISRFTEKGIMLGIRWSGVFQTKSKIKGVQAGEYNGSTAGIVHLISSNLHKHAFFISLFCDLYLLESNTGHLMHNLKISIFTQNFPNWALMGLLHWYIWSTYSNYIQLAAPESCNELMKRWKTSRNK